MLSLTTDNNGDEDMARTYRVGNTRDGRSYEADNRRGYFKVETKANRKTTHRAARHQTRQTLREVLDGIKDVDEAVTPGSPATGGWITH